MSQASEWASNQTKELMQMSFYPNHPLQRGLVLVERSGDCYLELAHKGIILVGGSLVPAEALRLARWILYTFAEAPDA